MTEKLIFDCDNTLGLPLKEVDDGLALLYLLGEPKLSLLGITTTFGNGTIDQVYSQTQKLANSLAREIPVLKGEGAQSRGAETPAAAFMVETVNKFPNQVTLLATGPVGNILTASRLDPGFLSKIKRIAVMGGYLEPLKLGYRNLQELNFSANPQAAHKVLNAPCPVTVFPGQACLDAPFVWRQVNQADWWPRQFRRILRKWLLVFGLYFGVSAFYLWDLLPAVYLAHPEFFDAIPFPIKSTQNHLKHGMLIRGEPKTSAYITLATGIRDKPGFYQHLETTWRRSAREYPLDSFVSHQRN